MNHLVAPSILSADFSNLQSEIEMINKSTADWVHVDVMDGVFVPNISIGIPITKAIKKHSTKPLDVHLMIVEPQKYIKQFKDAGANILSVHYEASTDLHSTIQKIKDSGMQAGVAINPQTPVYVLENIICEIDVVCLMSVNPGFGGQKFIESTYTKVKLLRKLIDENNSHAKIEADGGVTLENAPLLLKAGTDVLVAGNTVFASTNPSKTIKELKMLK